MLARMRRDLRTVVDRDPAARTEWEVALLWLWNKGAPFPARALSQAARWATGIEIHPAARIGDGVFIDHGAAVVIGETAEVGDDVTIYHGVTLGGTSLDRGKRHPTIGKRVVIGAGAKVLGNLVVGDDSRIGANAVLVRSVGEHSVVVGVPGQVIASAAEPASTGRGKTDPDPVSRMLQTLLTRVDSLEVAVSGHHHASEPYLNASGDWQEADFVI